MSSLLVAPMRVGRLCTWRVATRSLARNRVVHREVGGALRELQLRAVGVAVAPTISEDLHCERRGEAIHETDVKPVAAFNLANLWVAGLTHSANGCFKLTVHGWRATDLTWTGLAGTPTVANGALLA